MGQMIISSTPNWRCDSREGLRLDQGPNSRVRSHEVGSHKLAGEQSSQEPDRDKARLPSVCLAIGDLFAAIQPSMHPWTDRIRRSTPANDAVGQGESEHNLADVPARSASVWL